MSLDAKLSDETYSQVHHLDIHIYFKIVIFILLPPAIRLILGRCIPLSCYVPDDV